MKKFISALTIILCVTFLAHKAQAQGNLQFNQVVIITVPAGGSTNFTVPAGKVWKIESAGVGGAGSTALYMRDATATTVAYFIGISNITPFPFWLPESFSGSFVSGGTNPYKDVVTIIEFNIVP